MTDDEFIAAFESCTLSEQQFHHPDHVRMAFLYLLRFPALEAVQRFSASLKHFAAALGKPSLYHETITWAFLFLIRERMARWSQQSGSVPDWNNFAHQNPDLLTWNDGVLKRYYLEETLTSELARTVFVLPDRVKKL